MIELNSGLAIAANRIFSTRENANYSSLTHYLTLDNGKIFKKSIVIDVSKKDIEVPVIAREHIENKLIEISRLNTTYITPYATQKIVLPLYTNTSSIERKTFDGVIKQAFCVDYNARMQKIDTTKGDIYYGGTGLLLDSNLVPLIMCTYAAEIDLRQQSYVLTYLRPVCHINPVVFADTNKLVNKGIIKKLIPFYSNKEIPLYSSGLRQISNKRVKVIIDDFKDFFMEPVKPNAATTTNDSLNECLIDNFEDIKRLICR